MRKLTIAAALLLTGWVVAGLVSEDAPIPPAGTAGALHRVLSGAEEAAFLRGRALFDKDFSVIEGVGPHFNGDSCRSCHQDPVVGGAGGIDVQVQRPAISDGEGGYRSPMATGALAQTHHLPGVAREEIPEAVEFVEERNSPTVLGLGLIETISEATIRANADPDDEDDDGVLGIVHEMDDGSVGRFGWKAQVPTLEGFLRDALSNEMGISVPDNGNAFGDTSPNPEISQTDIDDLVAFMSLLDFPPKGAENAQTQQGGDLFTSVGCVKCHIPTMDGVELYSDLLLHDIQPDEFKGITQGMATEGLYRTAPLRGLRDTAPYFHDGRSETIDEAIRRHDGEATEVRRKFVEDLTQAERDALIAFLLSR